MDEIVEAARILTAGEHRDTTTNVLFWAAMAALGIGTVGGFVPWKSSRLSSASIQRRFYWAGSVTAVVLIFLAALPDWRSAIFGAFAATLALIAIAFRWTSHIKIRGRICAGYPSLRRPDPPPTRPPADEI